MTAIPFTKVVGAGNDFIVVDVRRRRLPGLAGRWAEASRALCDRHMGIGADGLLLLERSADADARMRVFNPDGSEADMCGNGARCVAQVLAAQGRGRALRNITIDTSAGRVSATVRGDQVAMQMSDPTDLRLAMDVTVDGRRLSLGSVNTGVPHAVVPVPSVDDVDVAGLGRALRAHPAFAPRGTNVNFMQPDRTRAGMLRLRTYERGVEAETLACGTGAAAAAVIYGLTQRRAQANGRPIGIGRHFLATPLRGAPGSVGRPEPYRVAVQVRSGEILTVSFEARTAGGTIQVARLALEGPARQVFTGMAAWPPQRS